MKAVKSNIYRKVRVVLNTERPDRPQWAKIVVDGQVTHTGQKSYIRRIAKRGITSCLLCKPPSFGPHPLGGGGFS